MCYPLECMLDSTIRYEDNVINDLCSDDIIRQTEAAYHLNKQDIDYEKLIRFLKSDSINLKCYALLKFDKVRNFEEAQFLLSCLEHNDSRVRELSSVLIKDHIYDPEYNHYFNNTDAINIFINSLKDTNPKVCRNISYCLQNVNDKLMIVKKIVKIIENQDYNISNSQNIFIIYWNLFALEKLLCSDFEEINQIIEEILNVITKTSRIKEYQIREKSAFLVRTLNNKFEKSNYPDFICLELDNLTKLLSSDENFYVRNAILTEN